MSLTTKSSYTPLTYESEDTTLSKPDKNVKPTEMRTLIIGLGGSGGNVLHELYAQLSDEQKNSANSIYLDLDKKDTSALSALGVRTIRISSADTVKEMASALGTNDGVYNWLPCSDADSRFLASGTDDGASQYRYKSRLCLANFLSNPSNELRRLLQEMCRPGITISRDTLRVMIVSSVAGGTGSGTFIELALYIRKFFRDIGHPEIRIMGLFACPELFAQTLTNEGGDENKRIAMYANAYAAIRELNAMNLAVSGDCGINGGYGKFINMSIDTRSEGYLFNSKDLKFSKDYNTKPFDLLYFVDLANRDGGILGDLSQYYKTMADVAYARLYSEMEFVIRSDESNELGARAKNPTAIYGSAGYARIIYPYEDILRYLAEQKTFEELDTKWFLMETKWNNYVTNQRKINNASGRFWEPSAKEREQSFINSMNKELASTGSVFQSIAPMIGWSKNGTDRATAYMSALNKAVATATGLEQDGAGTDGAYGLGSLQEVKTARQNLLSDYNNALEGTESYLERLKTFYDSAKSNMTVLAGKLADGIVGNSVMLSSAILPTDRVTADSALAEHDPVNLYSSLLRIDNKDIHPMAARYLLYRVRQEMRKVTEQNAINCEEALKRTVRSMELCLDQDPNDGPDTVDDIVEGIEKAFWGKERMAQSNLESFTDKFPSLLQTMVATATQALKQQTFAMVMENLDVLIAQYEGLYENMEQYRIMMRQRADSDLVLHDGDDDRNIYMGASPAMKQYYYYQQPSVRTALDSGNDEIYSAAGKSIYDALIKRTWKRIQVREAEAQSKGAFKPQGSRDDRYEDLAQIFDGIVDTYTKYLRERATYLQTSAMNALYRQCCTDCGLDPETDFSNNAVSESRIKAAMSEHFDDLIAKAQPLLRYTRDNTDGYFQDERDSSVVYKHLGMSPEAADELQRIFHAKTRQDALVTLKNDLGLPREPVISDTYSDYELFCFGAVHCLQPTQIFMFREDTDNSYYTYYQRRLTVAASTHSLAETPHIDKRWHVRGAIPYISPKLENEWNEKTMKALLYLMLQRQICFDRDAKNNPRFYLKLDGQSSYIQWPYGTPVNTSNVSRLLEYLADQEGLIEELAEKLDIIVNYQVSTLSNRTHDLSVYKAGMTTNELLRRMRCDLLVFEARSSEETASHGQNVKKPASNQASAEDVAKAQALYQAISGEISATQIMDQKKTMGGLLEFAWLLHKSEERLAEDRDFGEALLKCGANILEKFCRGMYGENLTEASTSYKHYLNLYNSAATKFLQEYVVATARNRKLTPEQLVSTNRNMESLGPVVTEGNIPDLDVPDCIRGTDEYDWISRNWVLKGDIINA